MSNTIYPLAYKLIPGQVCTLTYLGFPQKWKEALLNIARKKSVTFKEEYGLPTDALKKLVESWMEGVIALAPLKKDSHDEHWLTSCCAYSEKQLTTLCSMIKVWVNAEYVTHRKASSVTRQLANDFCGMICAKDLMELQTSAKVRLTHDDGTVCEEAYQAVPLLAVNRLLGREISLNGQTLHFGYATRNVLVSQPITDPKSRHRYSFVFDFSVQTTPPRREALLLCQMSIRRWIPDSIHKEHTPYLRERINAHIRISDDKYCIIPIAYDTQNRRPEWDAQDRECYDIWGYEQLPSTEDVLKDPAAYAADILLPYKNGMRGFKDSKIGTGVSAIDKADLYHTVSTLLDGMIAGQPEAERVSLRGQNFRCFKSPREYASSEDFRRWAGKCAETDRITFELYGLWKDPTQQELLQQVQEKIEGDFGEEREDSCLKIRILQKEVGDLADPMRDDQRATMILRRDEIVKQLGQTDTVTACIFVLPGPDSYDSGGDPKEVLRNAFAGTGRVVQFITPDGNTNRSKIENAVYDLYRQLGIVALLDFSKVPAMAKTPCVGMHLCTQVHGIQNKARFLPFYVIVDVLEGKTRVHCDAFSNHSVSYREACLEMAQLFWKTDLEMRCVEASRTPAKKVLIDLKNRCYRKEDQILAVVQSDGNTRRLWNGISDKEIGKYAIVDRYCPKEINAGMPNNPYPLSLADSGVRIIRIRSNREVPDYFTELSKKATEECTQLSSASGIFKYEDVYWGIHERPKDPQYTHSFKESRIDHPQQRFAEKDMIELYPLQLQSGDNADEWIFFANALRHIPIQYNQSTVLPLPLHLAKGLEEYLFDA